jgi:acetylornithine deacetylase/succinyl-diaminopimelate desuccinylase-like protein
VTVHALASDRSGNEAFSGDRVAWDELCEGGRGGLGGGDGEVVWGNAQSQSASAVLSVRLVHGMTCEKTREDVAAYLEQQLAALAFVGLEVEVEAIRAWEPVHVRASQDARAKHLALSCLAQALPVVGLLCPCVGLFCPYTRSLLSLY